MNDRLDSALLLLVAAGWSDKKVRELLVLIGDAGESEVLKHFRLLKRRVAGKPATTRKKPPIGKEEAADQALRLLRSIGPYSESEIHQLLAQRFEGSLDLDPISKGGLRVWLVALAQRVGAERMLTTIKSVRNDLVHNPRPGWTTRDLK